MALLRNLLLFLTTASLVQGSIDCFVEKLDQLVWEVNATISTSNEQFICNTQDGRTLSLQGAATLVDEIPVPVDLILYNVTVNETTILYTEDSYFQVKEEKARRLGHSHGGTSRTGARTLASSTGQIRAMLIRVSTSDGSTPPLSMNRMLGRLFNDPVSFASQMNACSWGAAQVVPAPYYDVTVNIDGKSIAKFAQDNQFYQEELVKRANEIITSRIRADTGDGTANLNTVSDMQFYVLPEVGNWVAYASLGGTRSVYNGQWFRYLTTLMHEAAHNMYLFHANEDGEYQDYTGYMSQLLFDKHLHEDRPLQCFNAQNHWKLGWYPQSKEKIVDTSKTELFRLAAFADYDKTNSQHHIFASIGSNVGGRVYMQYNRAKGINRDTAEYPDHLVVVVDTSRGTEVVCAISAPENTVCTIPQGNRKYIIEICAEDRFSSLSQMIVSAGFDGSRCNEVTDIRDSNALLGMTDAPSRAPTPSPTRFPTPSPTSKPTPSPTRAPTQCSREGSRCSNNGQCCTGLCGSGTCVSWELARRESGTKNAQAAWSNIYDYSLYGSRRLRRGEQ